MRKQVGSNLLHFFFMGNDESLVKLDPNKKILDLSNKGITGLETQIEELPRVVHLVLNGNRIKDLPDEISAIKSIQLCDNDYNSIPDRISQKIKNYSNLILIDFSYNTISKLTPTIFENPGLLSVYLYNNALVRIPKITSPLLQIDLGQNHIQKIPIVPNTLISLLMDCNRIEIVDCVLDNLKKVTLQSNLIKEISPSASFQSLLQLDLRDNKLTELPKNFDSICPRLRTLNISFNQIKELPKLPMCIAELDASFNALQELPENFDNYTCMFRCSLSNNKISNIGKIPPAMQYFNINNNWVEKIGQNSLPDLGHLYAMGNRLQKIPSFKVSCLTDVTLRYNYITKVKLKYFIETVRSIDLSYNQITEIPDDIFTLTSLYELILPGNQLKTISPSIAESFITKLNLSSNPIESLPVLPDSLEELYISSCNLTEIDKNVAEAKNLVKLIASSNNLTEIPFMPYLIELDISNNKIREFPSLPDTLLVLNLSFNQIVTLPNKMNFVDLEFLDLSFNNITTLPDFSQLAGLKHLILSCIPADGVVFFGENLIHLDITSTNLQILPEAKRPDFCYRTFDEPETIMRVIARSICYSITPAQSHYYGDLVFSVIPPITEYPVFGLIDNRRNTRYSKVFQEKFIMSLNKNSKTKKGLAKTLENALLRIKQKGIRNYFTASLASINGDKIRIAVIGHSSVFIRRRGELIQLYGYRPFTLFASKNGIYGTIGEDHDLSEYLVYKIPQKPQELVYDIQEEDEYLILLSNTVVDSLNWNTLKETIITSDNCHDLVANITSKAKEAMCIDNISVLVAHIPSFMNSRA